MVKIKDLPKIERPREKLKKKGVQALRKNELLAIILRTGIKGKNVLQLAQDVLLKYGDKKLIDVSFEELRNMHGVGPSKAAQIISAIELGKRLYREKVEKEVFINSPDDVLKEIEHIRENKKENFIVLYLDARNKLISKETISIGTIDSSLVHPREVYEPALRYFASTIFVAHNHPSGDTQPSKEDILITEKLVRAGKILSIELLDHLIIGKKDYFSFKEKGMING